MTKKILITGASGLIGTRLTELILVQGHLASHLSRSPKTGAVPSFTWNIDAGSLDSNALRDIDTIVNLAGAGVADKRWTASRKEEILESRIKSTQVLFNALKGSSHVVKSFISASAIGYYGFSEADWVFTEDDKPGNDFLALVTKQWEDEVDKISALGLRVVKLRIGIVLSEKAGALKEIATPIRFGVGAPLGSGKQFLSWIHIDDLCNMFIKAVEDETMDGSYNAVTSWCTNGELTRAIAKVLNKPLWLPRVPSFVLKIILGEMADMILLGNKVSPAKINKAGFQSRFTTVEGAMKDLTFPGVI
jgi:uncharacterized protein